MDTQEPPSPGQDLPHPAADPRDRENATQHETNATVTNPTEAFPVRRYLATLDAFEARIATIEAEIEAIDEA